MYHSQKKNYRTVPEITYSHTLSTVAFLGVPVESSVKGSAPVCTSNISTTSGQRKETKQKPGAKTRRANGPGTKKNHEEARNAERNKERPSQESSAGGEGKPAQEHDRTRPGEQHQKKKKPAQQARTGRAPDTRTVSLFEFGSSGSWVGALSFLLGSGVGARSSHEHREGDSTTTVGSTAPAR